MSTTCIEACELTKSFNGQKVVDGLSFSVEKGQVFGLLVRLPVFAEQLKQ